MAPPVCVIVSIKSFTYRGVAGEEFSNRYFFTGATPADASAWRALYDALTTAEKAVIPNTCLLTRAYGYNKIPVKGDSAVWGVDLRVAPDTPVNGTYAGTGVYGPGDSAVWVRWGMNRMSHGKRVYVRKYIHPAPLTASGRDTVEPAWITAANAFATKLSDGTFLASRKITDALGSDIVNHGASAFATTHTLKRRGKRPPT